MTSEQDRALGDRGSQARHGRGGAAARRRALIGVLGIAVAAGAVFSSGAMVKLVRGGGPGTDGHLPQDGRLVSGSTVDARRAEIEAMKPAEKERLRRNYDRFLTLDRAERDRIRKLYEAIENDPNAAELRAVMERYYEWLKTLSPYDRAELKDLPAEARIERIKLMREEQKKREEDRINSRNAPPTEWFNRKREPGSEALSADDLNGLLRWIEEVAPTYKARFLESLPEEQRQQIREELEKVGDPKRQRDILGLIWLRWQMEHPAELPPVTDEELASLRSKLSAEMRGWLEKLSGDAERQTVTHWIRRLIVLEYFLRQRPQFHVVSDEELADFLETKLDADQRRRLLSLPGAEMRRQLRFMYARSKMPDEMPDMPMPFFHSERGGRPGGGGNFVPGRGGPGGEGRFRPPGGFPQGGRGGRPQPGEEREGRGLHEPPPPPDAQPPGEQPGEPSPRS